ncbi:MAG: DUF3536 domain-containing protein, partial [Planctomycetota bacterium]
MNRYICVHAHFYQPPRENPWLESVELQDSAYPYHDWNERITAECYAPNMSSRILDNTGQIVEMVNIYSRISFNFGPSLLSWMETHAHNTYKAVLAADRESMDRFSGHGSAIAQAYNHMIMPLASQRDKVTQVRWGIRDFEYRFKRLPEGMWLPETAVDLKTLEVLADEGLRFAILAPNQAARFRKINDREWQKLSDASIDPTRAYRVKLSAGRTITLFFYDGPISRAIAFEDLLTRGENFAERLVKGFSEDRTWPQLMHIATDGETYGHHHRFGDMGLSYALHYIKQKDLAKLTIYGEYLDLYPPEYEVEIKENTSWSCAHGIERWRSNCGCSGGRGQNWNQEWRTPLREALDWLRDSIADPWEEKTKELLKQPWAARDDYIDILLTRSDQVIDRFLKRHAIGPIDEEKRIRLFQLLEMQRNAMLMYTSCGWFFDDISGIETVQIIEYAGRVIQLAEDVFGKSLEGPFLDRLEKAKSNVPQHADGRRIYLDNVINARVDLKKVAAHYAMSSLFEEYEEKATVYNYSVEQEDYRLSEAGKARLAMGTARFTSQTTGRSARVSFGVLHLGDHNISCGVRTFLNDDDYEKACSEVLDAFSRADFAQTIRGLDSHFGPATYSLKSLFRDEQRKITDQILESTLSETEASFRRLYEDNAPLMRFLRDSEVPLPKALHVTAEFICNVSLRHVLERSAFDREEIMLLLEKAENEHIQLDHATLEYAFRRSLERVTQRFCAAPDEASNLIDLREAADLLSVLPFEVNLWTVQNLFYRVKENHLPEVQKRLEHG